MYLLFTKEGGLFDFDLTLPLIIFEFIFLYFFLQQFFFTPVLSIIDKRRNFINEISGEISLITNQTSSLLNQYETILNITKTNLRVELTNFNEKCDKLFENQIHFILEKNQYFLKLFEITMVCSIPFRANKISYYSFKTEERIMEKALID